MEQTRVQTGLAYHQLQRLGHRGRWRPLVGAVLALGLTFAVVPLLVQSVLAGWWFVTGRPVMANLERVLDFGDPTPLGLAVLNLTLAAAIPVTFLLMRGLHGLRPGWLSSVLPRIRWGYFGICLLLSVVALVATIVVASLVPQGAGSEVGTELNDFTRTTRDFLIVIALLTPLQAAGEEYLFRGYLTQAIGSATARRVLSRVLAVVVPALLFAIAHGAGQSWPIFVDRLAFGLVAGVLVIATGGLEAALAMHVLNNFFAYGLALAFTDMASALNPTGGSWWSLPSTLTQSLVYLALAVVVARSQGLATRSGAGVLEASGPRV
jgi:uncharacterized protein